MGLYDELRVEVDLPNSPDEENIIWQTKSISRPAMLTYKITENGRLKERHIEREKVGTEEFEFSEHENLEIPQYEVTEEWWTDVEFHGSFEFHTSFGEYDTDEYEWYSYEAWFNNGDLETIIENPDR